MGIESAALAWLVGTSVVGTAASTIISATQSQDSPEPQPLPEPPKVEDAQKQAKDDLKRRQGAVGKQQTISAGLLTEEADTKKKTLLG
jgi:hypothetical protein